MSRFAAELPVVYVEPWRWLRQVRLSRQLLRQAIFSGGRDDLSTVEGGVLVLKASDHLPVGGSGWVRRLTVRRWLANVRQAVLRAGITRPVLWISQPAMGAALGTFGEALSIYHAVDEYTGYTGLGVEAGKRLELEEQRVLDAVDLTIVVSEELMQRKRGEGRCVYVVPNAVDFAAFSAARRMALDPPDLARIPRPRIGYCGLIGVRLDFRLVRELAAATPERQLVFVGKVDERGCEAELKVLQSLGNVHFLGEKPAGHVPAYVAGLDAGMLPYAQNRETENISPLKLYEYLACGLPVVATSIPSTRRHKDLVYIKNPRKSFGELCATALEEDGPTAASRRQSFAAENTWEDRVTRIREIVLSHLATGPTTRAPVLAGS